MKFLLGMVKDQSSMIYKASSLKDTKVLHLHGYYKNKINTIFVSRKVLDLITRERYRKSNTFWTKIDINNSRYNRYVDERADEVHIEPRSSKESMLQ